jgi:YesN/AraC family two-component response regulator
MEYQRNALRMGAIGYLGKPVTIDGVRSALDRLEKVVAKDLKRLLIVEDDERQRKAIRELVDGKLSDIPRRSPTDEFLAGAVEFTL